MSWFSFGRRRSASVARERLQILLTHERGTAGSADLVPLLREEVLKVVARHVAVDPDKVQVRIEREKSFSLLEIEIEIPGAERVQMKGAEADPARSGREGTKKARMAEATA